MLGKGCGYDKLWLRYGCGWTAKLVSHKKFECATTPSATLTFTPHQNPHPLFLNLNTVGV